MRKRQKTALEILVCVDAARGALYREFVHGHENVAGTPVGAALRYLLAASILAESLVDFSDKDLFDLWPNENDLLKRRDIADRFASPEIFEN